MLVKCGSIKRLSWLPRVLTRMSWLLSTCLYTNFLIRCPRLPIDAIKTVEMCQTVCGTRTRKGTAAGSAPLRGKTSCVSEGKTACRVLPRPEYPVNIPSLLTSHRADLVGLPRRRFPALPNSAYHPGDACLLAAGTDPGAFTATSYSRCPYRNELGQG